MKEPVLKAVRGDFAVTKRSDEVTVSQVVKVTRDGWAKELAPLSTTAARMTRDRHCWDEICLIKRDDLADPDTFIAECTARQTPDPATFEPFNSFEEVAQFARKHKRDAPLTDAPHRKNM